MKKIISIVLSIISLSAFAWQPKDTVQLIVPQPAGGSTDVIGRIIAEGLRAQGVTNIVVVNRPGATGIIGTNSVIKAAPDGHTMLLTGTSFLFNRLLNNVGADYDLTKSLSHVGLIGTVPNHLYAREGLANTSFKEIINQVKSGKQYSWGVTNPGAEFTARLLEARLGIKLNIIPYNGSAPAITDLGGGHIDFVIDSGSSGAAAAAVESKRIGLVAVLESKSDAANTVDAIVPGVVTRSWFGLSLPSNVDNAVVVYYNRALTRALQDPVVIEKLNKISVNIKPGTPQNFVDLIQSDYQKYVKIADKSKK